MRSLVGRRAELDGLLGALGDAESGRGRFVVLVGEAGIGKTRLADELGRRASEQGARVVVGRCWEDGGAPPYWPWVEVLRSLAAPSMPTELTRLLTEPGGTSRGDEDRQARFRLFDAVVSALQAATSQGLAVIILDDLHAADAPSLLLLSRVVRHLAGMPLLIIASHREPEPTWAQATRESLARIAREATVLPLARLMRGETAAFLDEAATDDAGIDALHSATDGNPLFIEETLRLLQLRGHAPSPATLANLPIPDGVAAIVGARLAALDPPLRELLTVAAIVGRSPVAATIARLVDRPVRKIEEQLASAADLGVMLSAGDGQWRFAHELVRATLERALPTARRAELHAKVAALIEAGPRSAADRSAIAHHMFAARSVVGVARAVEAALDAAESARESLAFEHAATVLERALAVLAGSPDARLESRVLAALGAVRIRAGVESAGKDACCRAADIARRLGEPVLVARAVLALGASVSPGASDAPLVATLEAAVAALPQDERALRARLLARLAAAAQPARDPARPMAQAREAIAVSAQLDDDETRREVLFTACAALSGVAPPAERLALDRELASRAARAGDRVQELRAQARLVFDHIDLVDPGAAEAARAAHERLAGEFGPRSRRWLPTMMQALLAVIEGRFAEGEHLASEARALQPGDGAWAARCHALHRFWSLRMAERVDEVLAFESELLAAIRTGPNGEEIARIARAVVHARAGDVDTVRAQLVEIGEESALVSADPVLLTWLAEAAAVAGDAERAVRIERLLAPRRRTLATWGASGMLCEGPLAIPLAECAAASGRPRDAIALLDEAIAMATAHGLRPAVDRALRLRAKLSPSASAPAAAAAPVLQREDDLHWRCRYRGQELRVRTTRGLDMLARLLEQPGRELHVLDLAAIDGQGIEASDAGDVIDDHALADYRRRLKEIAGELDEAETWSDVGRAARLRQEQEALDTELRQAVGLGGRKRKAASSSERARVNVQRRLRAAISRLQELAPDLGHHLDRAVRTGTFCCYDPAKAL